MTQRASHVHCVFSCLERGSLSGMRQDCDVAFYIDLRNALSQGIPFFMSANWVVLSPGINGVVPARFLTKWVDLRTRQMYMIAGPVERSSRAATIAG